MPVLTFARYILELSLMEYDLNVETSESMLATAVMYIALKVKEQIAYMYPSTTNILNLPLKSRTDLGSRAQMGEDS